METGTKQMIDDLRTTELDFFTLPRELLAREPCEARGKARSDSRMLVLDRSNNTVSHARVCDIGRYLCPGDIIVLNNSKTVPSVFDARREDGGRITLYLCSGRGDDVWHAYLEPSRDVTFGFRVFAGDGAAGNLVGEVIGVHDSIPGLYVMKFQYEGELFDILNRIAKPVYSTYARRQWELDYYQNFHACVPGSVEQPSAGRHFTPELLDSLAAQGIEMAYLTLHTGMSNLTIEEDRVGEHSMYEEYFSIDNAVAEKINEARSRGGRVLGIGTTVMRALETVADEQGQIRPFSGWTDLFIAPGYQFKAVDMFLTNFHGPRTTRLALIMAFAGIDLVKRGYAEAIKQGYLFYEFGDTTLTI
jgi:S-adenosylmethionine:tRNA ribosyltransferase-isomerase